MPAELTSGHDVQKWKRRKVCILNERLSFTLPAGGFRLSAWSFTGTQ